MMYLLNQESVKAQGWMVSFLGVLAAAVLFWPGSAQAVPSFARQTGWSCAKCHTVFPELTPAGRRFKLEGYMTDEMAEKKSGAMEVTAAAPVSAMIIADDTFLKSQPPVAAGTATDGSDNRGTVKMPDQLSLFYAGPITPGMGSFIQLTYEPDAGALSLDMLDIRAAKKMDLLGYDLVVGLDSNNVPTVQDAWNTGAAWGFPFAGSSVVPGPIAGTQIESLGGSVGSLGAYAYFNDLVYMEVSGYRSTTQGDGFTPAIQGIAPYWRVAVTQEFGPVSVEVGGLGMKSAAYPAGAGPTGPGDHASDLSFDAQAQYITDAHIVSIEASYITEKTAPTASYLLAMTENAENTLKQAKVNASYFWDRMVGVSVGMLSITGSSDAGMFAVNPFDGSATGSPNSQGLVYEIDYLPWMNTKFAAQYTMWSKFNGDSTSYDGDGRNASDNNALTVLAQLLF